MWLNHFRYPSADIAKDFAKEQYAGVYKSLYNFANRFYGIDNLVAGSAVSPGAFKSLYPIHVFDVDLNVGMEFSANVPANTQAYALVISGRIIKFKSDGSKMSVLF